MQMCLKKDDFAGFSGLFAENVMQATPFFDIVFTTHE
jgi:hypothetical protein